MKSNPPESSKAATLSRRGCLQSGAAALTGLCLGTSHATESDPPLEIIDCHTHFYDPSRPQGVPWPGPGPLYRTVLPKHLRELKQYRPVTGTVIVEASAWVEDNAWLLDLAADDPFVLGIVGRIDPDQPDFAKHLARFSANPLFRGIRISVGLLKKLLEANDLAALKALADRGLALDVNGGPETPAVIAKLARRLPSLTIVQNHIGNVPVTADRPPQGWSDGIRAAADHKNVYCKISGLVESAARHSKQPAPTDLEFYRPYLDVVWNAFGDSRVIYASNWPVSDRGATYEDLQRIAMQYAAEKGATATADFCSLNSKQAYRWVDRPRSD
ncbi:amidohydrolase family protein [Rosistilla oblonga]|uniref:amidohydrolase family protein n=1 Tax=Rosistilla oblonga TaxID=2527990 RepID=UPI003A96D13C